jgi:hypothetical protein
MKYPKYALAFFLLFTLFSFVQPEVRAQKDDEERARQRTAAFNDQKQGVLIRNCNGDLSRQDYQRELACREWYIAWRHPDGREWGRISGKTRDAVERQRDSDMKLMKGYFKNFSYDNPSAPTCDACTGEKTRPRNRLQDQILRNAEMLYDDWESKLEDMRYELIKNDIVTRLNGTAGKSFSFGSVLTDYVDALRDARERLLELRTRLDEAQRLANVVTRNLDVASRALRTSTSRLQTIHARLSPEELALLAGGESPRSEPQVATEATNGPEPCKGDVPYVLSPCDCGMPGMGGETNTPEYASRWRQCEANCKADLERKRQEALARCGSMNDASSVKRSAGNNTTASDTEPARRSGDAEEERARERTRIFNEQKKNAQTVKKHCSPVRDKAFIASRDNCQKDFQRCLNKGGKSCYLTRDKCVQASNTAYPECVRAAGSAQ